MIYQPLDSNVIEDAAEIVVKVMVLIVGIAVCGWIGYQTGLFPITHPDCSLCL